VQSQIYNSEVIVENNRIGIDRLIKIAQEELAEIDAPGALHHVIVRGIERDNGRGRVHIGFPMSLPIDHASPIFFPMP
jgi:hypothetical protein